LFDLGLGQRVEIGEDFGPRAQDGNGQPRLQYQTFTLPTEDRGRMKSVGRQRQSYSGGGQLTPTDNQKPKPIEKRSSCGKRPLIELSN
jgi:hypothetical protein